MNLEMLWGYQQVPLSYKKSFLLLNISRGKKSFYSSAKPILKTIERK
jgi:hypothetical protein